MSSSKIKKIHFVLNPKAGNGSPLKIFHQIEEELKSNNVQYTVFKSQGKRDIFHHVMSGDMPVCDVLCSMGGDGTIHETADALMQSGKANDFPMAVIPSGTGNAFAQTLGELQPKKAIRKILQGEAIKIDAMEIKQGAEVSYAVNIIGWGMASKVNQISDQLRALGGIRYNIASLIGIATMKKKRLALRMNQEVIDEDALLFLALNTVYTGKGMKMAPDADFSDDFRRDKYQEFSAPILIHCSFEKASNIGNISQYGGFCLCNSGLLPEYTTKHNRLTVIYQGAGRNRIGIDCRNIPPPGATESCRISNCMLIRPSGVICGVTCSDNTASSNSVVEPPAVPPA